jgi:hypothetical protein
MDGMIFANIRRLAGGLSRLTNAETAIIIIHFT